MQILHGTWLPAAEADFIQTGAFYLWVETTEPARKRSKTATAHPRQLAKASLAEFLATELGIKTAVPITRRPTELGISPQYFLLPTIADQPLFILAGEEIEVLIPPNGQWRCPS